MHSLSYSPLPASPRQARLVWVAEAMIEAEHLVLCVHVTVVAHVQFKGWGGVGGKRAAACRCFGLCSCVPRSVVPVIAMAPSSSPTTLASSPSPLLRLDPHPHPHAHACTHSHTQWPPGSLWPLPGNTSTIALSPSLPPSPSPPSRFLLPSRCTCHIRTSYM